MTTPGTAAAPGATAAPATPTPPGTCSSAPLAELVAERIGVLVAEGHAPGVAAAVVRGDEHAVVCRGVVSRRSGIAVTAGTGFELGSLTKTYTAVLFADMVARGEVGTTDPITAYLPAWARPHGPAADITLLDLATHTAGLPRLPAGFYRHALPHWVTGPYAHYTLPDLLAATAGLRPGTRAGGAVRYSTFGVGLLGQLLAAAADRDYDQLLTERVLRPLGLNGTTPRPTCRTASGHWHGRHRPNWHFGALAPAGALCAPADDLLRYLRAQLRPDSTPLAAALADTHRPRRRNRNGTTSTCLVWLHRTTPGRTVLWHTGGTGGFTAFLGFSPDTDAGVALVANTAPTVGQAVLRTARRLLGHVTRPS